MKSATHIAAQLVECGIYIRVLRDGKMQAIDYTQLQPEEVQELERWDKRGWHKILDGVAGALGQTISKTHMDKIDGHRQQCRNAIIAILTLLRAAVEIDIT